MKTVKALIEGLSFEDRVYSPGDVFEVLELFADRWVGLGHAEYHQPGPSKLARAENPRAKKRATRITQEG